MPSLPPAIVPLLSPFASLFDARTWRKAQILLTGVILAPGRRTVSTVLYALGLQGRGDFALFHHVLSRASWSLTGVGKAPIRIFVQEWSYPMGGSTHCISSGGSGPGRACSQTRAQA